MRNLEAHSLEVVVAGHIADTAHIAIAVTAPVHRPDYIVAVVVQAPAGFAASSARRFSAGQLSLKSSIRYLAARS